MNWHHKPKKILITGTSGSGKTTLWLNMLARWPARWKFVFDPDCECPLRLGWRPSLSAAALDYCVHHFMPVCFDPSQMFPARYPVAFDWFSRWCLEVSKHFQGPKVLAVDEIQRYTDTGKGGIPDSFQEVIDVGRRHELDLLLVSQRPNEVNDKIRSHLTEVITFRHNDRLPLAWLSEDFEPRAVARLRVPGEYLVKHRQGESSKAIRSVHTSRRSA